MYPISQSCVVDSLQQRIDNTTSTDTVGDFFLPKNVSDTTLSVTDVESLPDLTAGNLPSGTSFFVDSLDRKVVATNCKWVDFAGNVFREDIPGNFLYSWGANSDGQVGDNTTNDRSSPVQVVGGFTDWCGVSKGIAHTMAIRSNNTVWAWGYNFDGEVGDGTSYYRSSPVQVVGGFTDWTKISAGAWHSTAIRADGTLWAWGWNSSGQLGIGTATDGESSPIEVLGGFTDWCFTSGGRFSTSAIRTNGTLWSWGENSWGQLGDGTTIYTSSPIEILGGFTDWCHVSVDKHALAIRTNGTLWAWGNNECGVLGINTALTPSYSPVEVAGGFTDWCKTSAGESNSAAIRTNGTLWTWGLGGFLGDGTTISKSSPTQVAGGFSDWCTVSVKTLTTFAIRTNGTLWAWGGGNNGAIGNTNLVTTNSPVEVCGGFTDWVDVTAGFFSGSALRIK